MIVKKHLKADNTRTITNLSPLVISLVFNAVVYTFGYRLVMSHLTYLLYRLRFISKTVIIAVMCLSLVIVYNTYSVEVEMSLHKSDVNENIELVHKVIVDNFYRSHKSWVTSKLGEVLYKDEEYPTISEENRNRTFRILIWKHWKILQNRHLYYFGSTRHDPLSECSVTNCEFTGDDSQLETADAVVVHLHRGQIPVLKTRKSSQRWIFLNDESPYNVFALAKRKPKFSELHNVFNWSMTYGISADIPVPYGRTVALKKPKFQSLNPPIADIVPNWEDKRRDVLLAILVSNCGVQYRIKLIKELQKYVQVDVHGKCGDNELKNSCPGHFRSDCEVMSQYLFYLVLENSKCKEYMTEKLFYNAYSRGAIPIIQGPSAAECETFLPPNSYLHIDNFATLQDLLAEIIRISNDDKELLNYHKWRNHFEVVNEHGYFGSKSFHLCRLCEAMNYNDRRESVYDEEKIRRFLDPEQLCRKRD